MLGVVYAAEIESAWAIVGAAIYGATLIFTFLASTLYHSLVNERAKRIFLAFDHIAIFLLIAGTYTAITLAVMNGTWQGWVMFGVTWGLALAGTLLRLVWLRYMHPVFYLIYLAMGWLGFMFADAVEAKVGWAGVEIDDRRSRHTRQQRSCRRQQSHRLLMAVAVQQDPRRTWLQGQRCRRLVQMLLEELLEEERHARHVSSAALGVAAQQIRGVFADG